MAYLPNQQYVHSTAGIWTPVGYGSTDLPAPVTQRDTNTSRSPRVSTFASLVAAPMMGLINTTFYTATAITDNYNVTVTGSGTATSTTTDGFATLASGTTANSSVRIDSKDVGTYNGISPLLFLNGLRAPQAGVAGCVRRWGYYDTSNGYFFEDNAGTFRVVSRKAGVDTAVASGSFNGLLGTTYTLDQNGHFFEIEMTGGRAVFMIDQVVLHVQAVPAASTTSSATLNNSIRVEITNTTATNMSLELRGQNLARLGTIDSKRINETLTDSTDAELVRAVLTGFTSAGVYTNVGVTAAGLVRVDGSGVTQPVSMATNTPDITDRAARAIGTVTQQAITKGTQGTTGVTTQDLKDAGRTPTAIYAEAAAGVTAVALVSGIKQTGNAATPAAATSFGPTTGKTLRLQEMTLTLVSTAATNFNTRVQLRTAATTATISSPIIWSTRIGHPSAPVAGSTMTQTVTFPDGLEIPNGQAFSVTHLSGSAVTTYTLDVTILGYEY